MQRGEDAEWGRDYPEHPTALPDPLWHCCDSQRIMESRNSRLLWVGWDLRTHLVPPPTLFTIPVFSNMALDSSRDVPESLQPHREKLIPNFLSLIPF